jgi:hypothetical protein
MELALAFVWLTANFAEAAHHRHSSVAFATVKGQSCRRHNFFRTKSDANPSDRNVLPLDEDEVDIAIVGAGIGGLCAGAILNTLYNKKVGIYESHYLPGGCAHAFERRADNGITFTFDSGPTIVLGCSHEPYNPLQQVLRAVGVDDKIQWIPYDGWGIIEHPQNQQLEKRWKLKVGPNYFEEGPLQLFPSNSSTAVDEFNALREVTKPLVIGASTIPAMAMRPGSTSLIPLLRYLPSLFSIIGNGVEVSVGPFGPFMNGVSNSAVLPFAVHLKFFLICESMLAYRLPCF